jgi:HSP20 family protein
MASDIFDELNRRMWSLRERRLEPLTYIQEKEDRIIVEMDLPMVKKEDINLRLVDDELEVEATLKRSMRFEGWSTLHRRHEFKYLYKRVSLPCPVTREGATASLTKGILRIELPKVKEKRYNIKIE